MHHISWILRLALIAVSLLYGGCSATTRVRSDVVSAIDLTDRFRGDNARHLSVIRKGQRKDAVVLIAPAAVSASLQGASGSATLEAWATPVFNVGDGVQMDLFLIRGSERLAIGSRYFDAARKAEDRDWIPIAYPLEVGENDQMEIRVSAGPQGDLTADWLALSSMRLVQRGVVR